MEPNTPLNPSNNTTEFIPLPSQHHPPARLNASFAKPTTEGDTTSWEPAEAWDNPIWGWLLLNPSTNDLYFFDRDGSFHCELRLDDPQALVETSHDVSAPNQLQRLLDHLRNETAFRALSNMLAVAVSGKDSDVYAELADSSLPGYPFALVTVAFGVELATATLAPEDAAHLPAFKLELGSADRSYDGLVGSWPCLSTNSLAFDFSKFCTHVALLLDGSYAPEPSSASPVELIAPANYPSLPPSPPPLATSTEAPATAQRKNLTVFGALVDPSTPLHAACEGLETKELNLEPWVRERAVEKIKVFFHARSVDGIRNVAGMKIGGGGVGEGATDGDTAKDRGKVASLGTAEWEWLQPYEKKREGGGLGEERLGEERPRFEAGAGGALEGFLLVRKPGGGEG
ncbi:uncharacterized protein BDZ99DRAFT_497662 [Mytilinidion resinicola]|uniref:Uncharacterized protein n=1 Tax=Mytilinidion resinicola TaxID=574789 RepID=A0A6A6YPH0_9PEZI|nr:uncharacterized protein BDZ99DRAFT_497662 [Mytilinidion resinicola]KAF2810670.1 hypothetical protein BDZ99DRAFT_497662 [Mytilinidion resinicola]